MEDLEIVKTVRRAQKGVASLSLSENENRKSSGSSGGIGSGRGGAAVTGGKPVITRQDLRQLRYLKREIELLHDQIEGLEGNVVTDKVRGSDPEHPWTEKSFYITGFDREELSRRRSTLKRKMQRRVDDLLELRTEILEFVESIDDSLLRQIIVLRHVNGLTWDQVAREIGGRNTADGVRMMHDRYFERG